MLLAPLGAAAQLNKTTMPFLNVAITGACDSTITMKVKNNILVYDEATVMKINGSGYVEQVISYDSNGTKGAHITAWYNGDSKADSAEMKLTMGSNTFRAMTFFGYDGSGNILTQTGMFEIMPGMRDSSEIYFYSYDGSGKMTQWIKRTKSGSSMNWKRKVVFTYNGSGKVTREDEYDYNEGTSAWEQDGASDFTYNGNGNKTSEVRSSYPGAINYYRETITYNANNRRLIQLHESYDNGSSSWRPTGKDSSYYLSNDQGYSFSYTYINNAFVLEEKDTCIGGSAPTGITPLHAGLTMQVYPNPASKAAYITVTDPHNTHVELLTLNGAAIYAPTTPVNGAVVLDIQHLPTGIYLVRATHGTETAMRKLVIVP